jgi:imidazolonepropionase-like amidohydrolase
MNTRLQSKFILKNVTVIDGTGGAARAGCYCAVDDGNISGIGPMAEFRRTAGAAHGVDVGTPEGFQEIDLSGHYVMPGLIDAHVHLAGGRGDYIYGETEVLAEPKLVRAMRSVYEAQKILKRGFTSVRDISWNGLYLKRIFGEGILPGPRIIACGPGLTRTGGHADLFQYTEGYVKEQHFWASWPTDLTNAQVGQADPPRRRRPNQVLGERGRQLGP